MKKASKILLGILLIAVGVIFALNAFQITHINVFFDGWWTLFIIIPCLFGLFTEQDKTGNLVGILIGVFLLLWRQGILKFSLIWKLAIPAIIIILGIKLIFGALFNQKSDEVMNKLKAEGKTLRSGYAAFSGTNLDFNGELFEGAELTAVFGSVKCDLTRAIINKDCVINASAIFGGIDILLPPNVNLSVHSNSIFGGISHKKYPKATGNAYTIYVNGTCAFGGIEIK